MTHFMIQTDLLYSNIFLGKKITVWFTVEPYTLSLIAIIVFYSLHFHFRMEYSCDEWVRFLVPCLSKEYFGRISAKQANTE